MSCVIMLHTYLHYQMSVLIWCVSPPYDNLRDYESGYSLDIVGLGEQLYRVIKPGGVCVWVVGDATINGVKSGTSFRTVLSLWI